jgi:hypothetical protein
MEYAKEVDIADNNDEYAVGDDGDNGSLLRARTTMMTSTPAPPAALWASHSQQCLLRV